MAVTYRKDVTKTINDDFTKVLRETQDLFKQKHAVSIVGRDFEDILTTQNLFEEYVNSFTENMEATEAEQIESLANTFRESVLQESLAGVQPFASLTMPTLIKLWARLSLKYAVPTEPVESPAFTVSYMKPYILDPNGVKRELPEAINDIDNNLAEKVRVTENAITVPTATPSDLRAGTSHDPNTGSSPMEVGPGKMNVDKRFSITSFETACSASAPTDFTDGTAISGSGITVHYLDSDGNDLGTTAPSTYWYKCNIKVDIYRRLYGEVSCRPITGWSVVKPTDASATVAYATAIFDTDDTHIVKDTIFGFIDLEQCQLTLARLSNKVSAVKVLGWFSSENHVDATNVGFDITRKDIEIGTGSHIEASLPLELLQDTKAMYQIDGAAELVDIMSNVCAQKLDLEIYNFLRQSLEANFEVTFEKVFDVIPPASYAINPTEWLNELKKLIDILATQMRNKYKTYNGYFVIIGNPIDTQIIPNVTWTFNNITDTQNGVEVQYSMGAMSGANKYTIISSDLMREGEMIVFFVPTTDKFKTYTYYPYTFNVVQNYLNTRTTNVPSVMLTKRHTIEEFTPIIGRIAVRNNDGSVYAANAYSSYDPRPQIH